jgi:hypothetical protein
LLLQKMTDNRSVLRLVGDAEATIVLNDDQIIFSKRPAWGSALLVAPLLLGIAILCCASLAMMFLVARHIVYKPSPLLVFLFFMFALVSGVGLLAFMWFQTHVFTMKSVLFIEAGFVRYRCGLVCASSTIALKDQKPSMRILGNPDRNGWACRLQVRRRNWPVFSLPLIPAFVVSDRRAFHEIATRVSGFLRDSLDVEERSEQR